MTTCVAFEREAEISEREIHTVIIAGAVAAIFGERARIRQIRLAGAVDEKALWLKSGRTDVQESHGLRPLAPGCSMRDWGAARW